MFAGELENLQDGIRAKLTNNGNLTMDDIAAVQRYQTPLFSVDREDDATTLISRRQLHDDLLVFLRELIINGELAEDTKIPEKELCVRFSVSRTPLREALKVLAFEGLVVLNHNRGAIVKPLSLKDIEEVFPIYGRLEGLAGKLACERLSKDGISDLMRLHERMIECTRNEDVEGVVAVNEQIHASIQAASGNRNLLQLLRYVTSKVRRARLVSRLSKTGLVNALAEHERIMSALEARNAALFAQAIRDHIENRFRSLRDAWIACEEGTGVTAFQDYENLRMA
jgi:DNA-binding GntR family transcriptional regulator